MTTIAMLGPVARVELAGESDPARRKSLTELGAYLQRPRPLDSAADAGIRPAG